MQGNESDFLKFLTFSLPRVDTFAAYQLTAYLGGNRRSQNNFRKKLFAMHDREELVFVNAFKIDRWERREAAYINSAIDIPNLNLPIEIAKQISASREKTTQEETACLFPSNKTKELLPDASNEDLPTPEIELQGRSLLSLKSISGGVYTPGKTNELISELSSEWAAADHERELGLFLDYLSSAVQLSDIYLTLLSQGIEIEWWVSFLSKVVDSVSNHSRHKRPRTHLLPEVVCRLNGNDGPRTVAILLGRWIDPETLRLLAMTNQCLAFDVSTKKMPVDEWQIW